MATTENRALLCGGGTLSPKTHQLHLVMRRIVL
jgi:hypothetical protein